MKRCSNKSNLDIVKSYLSGERPFIQVGWTPDSELKKRKEGEIWTENGKKYIKEKGIKKAYSDKAKFINEERCMLCNADTRWGNRYDREIWPKTRKCYDCFIEFETQLKIKGLYDNYIKNRDYNNLKSGLVDFKSKLEETINWCNSDNRKDLQYFNGDGSQEIWKDNTTTINKVREDAGRDLKLVQERLDDVTKELSELSTNVESVKKLEEVLKEKYKNGREDTSVKIEVLNN